MATLLRKLASKNKQCLRASSGLLRRWQGFASRASVPYSELVVGEALNTCTSQTSLTLQSQQHITRAWLKGSDRAGVPRETFKNEQRVAVTPASCAALLKAGFQGVVVESGAGAAAGFVVSFSWTVPFPLPSHRHIQTMFQQSQLKYSVGRRDAPYCCLAPCSSGRHSS